MVVGRHKNEFFLATFQWLLLLSAIFGIVWVDQGFPLRRSRLVLRLLATSGLVVAIWHNRAIVPWTNSPDALRFSSWNQRIIDVIRQHQESLPGANNAVYAPKVFFTFAGPVGMDSMRWKGLREGFRVEVFDHRRSADLAQAKAAAESADYVVLPNQGLSDYYRWLPSASLQAPLLEWILADPRFKPLLPVAPESHYFLFAHLPHLEAQAGSVVTVDGIATLEGFLNEEGPYPQWALPRVRWMNRETARICLLNAAAPVYRAKLRFRANSPGRVEIFDAANSLVTAADLTPGGFQELTLDTGTVNGKSCVELRVKLSAPRHPQQWLLFSKISLEGQP